MNQSCAPSPDPPAPRGGSALLGAVPGIAPELLAAALGAASRAVAARRVESPAPPAAAAAPPPPAASESPPTGGVWRLVKFKDAIIGIGYFVGLASKPTIFYAFDRPLTTPAGVAIAVRLLKNMIFWVNDIEEICKFIGHQGCSSKYPDPFSYVLKDDMRAVIMGTMELPALRLMWENHALASDYSAAAASSAQVGARARTRALLLAHHHTLTIWR
jgi:hypothetical protein